MQIETWLAFIAIAFVATVTPGPAILLVVTNALRYGLLRSVATVLGNVTGLLIMSLTSVLGLSTLILYSSVAFSIVKWVGVLYLLYIGLTIWRKGLSLEVDKHSVDNKKGYLPLYFQGLIVALTNPKAILFTTALFPQFIVLDQPLAYQFTVLVVSFMFLSASCLLGYALLFLKFKSSARFQAVFVKGFGGKVFGTFFMAAGAYLATLQNS